MIKGSSYRPAVTQGDPTIVPTRVVRHAIRHLTASADKQQRAAPSSASPYALSTDVMVNR